MSKDQSREAEWMVNDDIRPGDRVSLWDGSSFTLNHDIHKDIAPKSYYIVDAYPELGIREILKHRTWTVVETNVINRCVLGVCNRVYMQDIVIECDGIQFRTASSMVKKLN